MAGHILTGFGFGPIQSGLFASEAFKSKNFSRIVVLEVDQGPVDAVRANKGTYFVNVAKKDGIAVEQVEHRKRGALRPVQALEPVVDDRRP